ncbi:hypothetical protein [Streptomyces albospinus]|nr:hypothetical protein [Streptomyces albospinus]
MWSASRDSRLTAPVDGLYLVSAHQIQPGSATMARATILVNGAAAGLTMSFVSSSSGGQANAATRPIVLKAGDYVEMAVYSDTALTIVPAAYSKAALIWQGPA